VLGFVADQDACIGSQRRRLDEIVGFVVSADQRRSL
jgi:hypothetical protein